MSEFVNDHKHDDMQALISDAENQSNHLNLAQFQGDMEEKMNNNNNDRTKISNFSNNPALATNCGTLFDVSSEILLGKPYSKAVDLSSLGVIIYVLLSGSLPFYSDNDIASLVSKGKYDFGRYNDYGNPIIIDKFSNSTSTLGTLSNRGSLSNLQKDLISHLLEFDATKRYNMYQVLNHPWLTGDKLRPHTQNIKSAQMYTNYK